MECGGMSAGCAPANDAGRWNKSLRGPLTDHKAARPAHGTSDLSEFAEAYQLASCWRWLEDLPTKAIGEGWPGFMSKPSNPGRYSLKESICRGESRRGGWQGDQHDAGARLDRRDTYAGCKVTFLLGSRHRLSLLRILTPYAQREAAGERRQSAKREQSAAPSAARSLAMR
jgi:hypothetical protein